MSTRIPAVPSAMRKAPRQARSQATVQAIVTAAARILGERGWAGFTTNAVAALAGVSIGSLYQYFPDKRALVDAVRRAHTDDVLAAMDRALAGTQPLARRADLLVRGLVAAHSVHPGLHRVLLDASPRHAPGDAAQADVEARLLAGYDVLAGQSAGGPKASRRARAQVLADAVDGVIHNAARRGTLQSPRLRRELVRLICAQLVPGGG